MSTASQPRQVVFQPRVVQTDGDGRLIGVTGSRDEFVMEQNEPLCTRKFFVPTTVSGIPTNKTALEGSLVFDKISNQLLAFDGTTWNPASIPTWTQVLEKGETSGNFTPTITNDQQIQYTGPVRIGGGGVAATATWPDAVAIGQESQAISARAIGIGWQSKANVASAVAVGDRSIANAIATTAVGLQANAQGDSSSAYGRGAYTYLAAVGGVALGYSAGAQAARGVAIGNFATSEHAESVALGFDSTTTAANQLRLGRNLDKVSVPGALDVELDAAFHQVVVLDTMVSNTDTTNRLTIPTYTSQPMANSPSGSIMVDTTANAFYYRSGGAWFALSSAAEPWADTLAAGNTSGDNTPTITNNREILFNDGIRVGGGGVSTAATGFHAISVGANANAAQIEAVAVGADSQGVANQASGFGKSAKARATRSTALGYNTDVAPLHLDSTALGSGATTTAADQLRLGTSATTVSVPGILDVELNAAFHQAVVLDTMTSNVDTTNRLTIPTYTSQPMAPSPNGSIMVDTTANTFYYRSGGNWIASGSGSVTSVGLSAPAEFTVSGSPVTGSGTLTLTKASQAANLVWAGPTAGAAAAPTFRGLVWEDLPATEAGAGSGPLAGQVIGGGTTNQQLWFDFVDFDTGGIVNIATDTLNLSTDSYWVVHAYVEGNDNGSNHAGNTTLTARLAHLDGPVFTNLSRAEWSWKAGIDSTFSGVITSIVKTGNNPIQFVFVRFDNNTGVGATNDVLITNYKLRAAKIGIV